MKKIANSRYGDRRKVTSNGHGIFTIEGSARYYRVGMNEDNSKISYFDPEGGPMIMVDDDFEHGKITDIFVENADEGKFKIRIEVGE
jgi:hypothetical protein